MVATSSPYSIADAPLSSAQICVKGLIIGLPKVQAHEIFVE